MYLPRNRRPLSRVDEGEKVTVREIHGGRGVNKRLSELGIGVGASLTVVQNCGGPVIVSYGGSRMALGQGISMKILVE
ncbi:MAG: ferrous iron transport protein A [Candidatus Thermoplasmatota archaeon]|nr:ferrous iron transport protein A [Candidatus Thermoplasmatota archaeon]